MVDLQAILPPKIKATFERFQVVKPATWPKLDVLVKHIAAHKMKYEVSSGGDQGATAVVFCRDEEFSAMDAEPERALAKAFARGLDYLQSVTEIQPSLIPSEEVVWSDEVNAFVMKGSGEILDNATTLRLLNGGAGR